MDAVLKCAHVYAELSEGICQNEAAGNKRARFWVATENGLSEDLAAKCQSLISDEGSLGNLVLAADTYDTFLASRT